MKNNTELSSNGWWNNKQFTTELEARYKALESGIDKGLTLEELKASMEKHKRTRNKHTPCRNSSIN